MLTYDTTLEVKKEKKNLVLVKLSSSFIGVELTLSKEFANYDLELYLG
jgi:hypothetical protein